MVEKILNNTIPYGKIRASHEGSLHSSTLSHVYYKVLIRITSDLLHGFVVSYVHGFKMIYFMIFCIFGCFL